MIPRLPAPDLCNFHSPSASPKSAGPSYWPARSRAASWGGTLACATTNFPLQLSAARASLAVILPNNQETSGIGLTDFGHSTQAILTTRGMLPWQQNLPNLKVTPGLELRHIRSERFHRYGCQRSNTRHGLEPARSARLRALQISWPTDFASRNVVASMRCPQVSSGLKNIHANFSASAIYDENVEYYKCARCGIFLA